ncbi:TM2 domain-containing protein [Weissella viridescens]|uniref:TM2 domain-containing protein n=1 Tax=Weissella viridescens TaxID=1629 RepID=A0A3P2RGP4_WEIVI|nr:TM2 domain-containing protein [Weissella viridescens]RRG18726.1 TM2 domain-containing protein [Weissella viridescens]
MNNELLRQLTVPEQTLVDAEVARRTKSEAATYILAVTFGCFGAHRYYRGKTGTAVAMTLIPFLTFGLGIFVTYIWMFVDLCLIPGWQRDDEAEVERTTAQHLLDHRRTEATTFQQDDTTYGAAAYSVDPATILVQPDDVIASAVTSEVAATSTDFASTSASISASISASLDDAHDEL